MSDPLREMAVEMAEKYPQGKLELNDLIYMCPIKDKITVDLMTASFWRGFSAGKNKGLLQAMNKMRGN